ncbi:MAG: hypothetical protein LBT33_08225 [Spirochaetia bacterium]|jgi:hypothetical protein|nr:hypothetical protein [Spirochaetia bacterium]
MRSREIFVFAALACLCGACVSAAFAEDPQAPSAAAGEEPAALPEPAATADKQGFHEWFQAVCLLLGTDLEEAFQGFGVPQKVFSARGEESWQDDVVFEYGEGLSLFWHRDRVWQLRFGPGFPARFSDIGMGSSREEVAAVLGKPFHGEGDWLLYHFAGQGYPVRLRLFFGENGLEDIYIYRGDF